MSSIISAVKRKLAFLTSLIIPGNENATEETAVKIDDSEQSRPTKRQRLNGATTPILGSDLAWEESPYLIVESLENPKSSERIVLSHQKDHVDASATGSNQSSDLIRILPHHVLSKCLAYVSTRSDRFALQTSCTLFRKLSNLDHMLAGVDLGGDWPKQIPVQNGEGAIVFNGVLLEGNNRSDRQDNRTDRQGDEDSEGERFPCMLIASSNGRRGILSDSDTSISACQKLIKFSAAGNLQATYMLAMILCYCLENVSEGLSLLRLAASHGDLRSIYNLALILRDTRPAEANHCLALATHRGYIPAWQEKLTPTEMRVRFGDLDASSLSKYLDPPCLNRLLGRHYLESNRVKKHQTSHCWNPLCGRWSYKATSSSRAERLRRLLREGNRENAMESDAEADNPSNNNEERYSIEPLLPNLPDESVHQNHAISPLGKIKIALQYQCHGIESKMKVSRMKMCSSCRRAKYCSKLCQVYDWRSGRHKAECPFLNI